MIYIGLKSAMILNVERIIYRMNFVKNIGVILGIVLVLGMVGGCESDNNYNNPYAQIIENSPYYRQMKAEEDAKRIKKGVGAGLLVMLVMVFAVVLMKKHEKAQKELLQEVRGSKNADDMKKCPYCANDIKKAAILCQYCGKDVKFTVNEVNTDVKEKTIASGDRGVPVPALPAPSSKTKSNSGYARCGTCKGKSLCKAYEDDAEICSNFWEYEKRNV